MVETTITGRLFNAGVLGRREAFGESFDPVRSRRRNDAFDAASRNPGGGPATIEAQAIPADVPRGDAPRFPRLSSTFVAQFIAQQVSPPATTEQRTRFETALGAYRQAQAFLDARRAAAPAAGPANDPADNPASDDA